MRFRALRGIVLSPGNPSGRALSRAPQDEEIKFSGPHPEEDRRAVSKGRPFKSRRHPFIVGLVLLLAAFGFAQPLHAADAGPLVDAQWLADNLDTPNLVILDATGNPGAFMQGHVPGARYTDYSRDAWRYRVRSVPGMLPPVPYMERLFGSLGITNADHIVIIAPGFDAGDMGIATRIYWTFKVLGHDAVSILDGGMQAYRAGGFPLSKDYVKPSFKPYKANFRPEYLADQDDVKAALKDGTPLIDARPPAQFQGREKSAAVLKNGTIPGAIGAPAMLLTKPKSGTFRDKADLEALFGTPAASSGAAIAFCNTGHWASISWFVMSEILGNKQARLYDGSLADWSRTPENPMVVPK